MASPCVLSCYSSPSAIALPSSFRPLPSSRTRASHRFLITNVADQDTADTPTEPPPRTALISPAPSLLTSSNILKAFRGEDLITPDHYATLGVPRGASYGEVRKAFRDNCERIVEQGSDEDAIRAKLRILKDSYEVLSSEEQRRLYDWSLLHAESSDGTYRWPYEADITQRSSEPGPPKAPLDEEGIRMVGNFFLAWFILSCILSFALR